MAILSSKSFDSNNAQTRKNKGPLVRVELAPGRFVKMYEADAIEGGYLSPKKSKPASGDKKRAPAGDKSAAGPAEPGDDLTTIPGVGKATERALQARGITTLAQLRQTPAARLSFLTAPARQAIEDWRNG